MQLHQLEYFVAVAETGGFSRGAERVHTVQSAVSAAVSRLEAELGSALFERLHHAVLLTAEGEALLPHARAILDGVARAREAVAGARGELVGVVTLGTMAHVGSVDLAAILAGFHARHPGVVVRLRQTGAGSRTSIEEVRSGALDLALVSTQSRAMPGVGFDELFDEPLAFVCWPGHRLAERGLVDVADAADESYIDFPTGWGNRDAVDRLFDRADVVRSINTEVTAFDLAIDLVRRRLGVTVMPWSGVPDSDDIVKLRVKGRPTWHVKLARPLSRTLSTAAERLGEAIVDTARRPSA